MEKILQIRDVTKMFGGLTALKEINLEAVKGQIVGIIGPNGAGKTTLFNCLTGLYHPTAGQVIFENKSIVPLLSRKKMQRIFYLSVFFMIFSILWAPVFWAVYLPGTYYKVELTLLTLFILLIRVALFRGFRSFAIWAWGLGFAFLLGDIAFSAWLILHFGSLPDIPGTAMAVKFPALVWAVPVLIFNLYFLWQLMTSSARQLYGFRTGPDSINRYGISRTFQNIRLFSNLSVLDNVKIGAHGRMKAGLVQTILMLPAKREEESRVEKDALDCLRFVGLEKYAFQLASSLPYGEQRRLEIARALASSPSLLLLDEPAAGMNPFESSRLIELIRKIRDRGITIIMIEHDMKVMMTLADIIYVMDHGETIAEGTPDKIRNDSRVIEAYLGRGAGDA